jgi:hypothetical protein
MDERCPDRMGLSRCEKPAGHEGFHRRGAHVWGFVNPEPEWRKRLPAKELGR